MLMLGICRPAGALEFWSPGFYRYIAPTALDCRPKPAPDFGGQRRRRGIFVESHRKNDLAPIGATYSGCCANTPFITSLKQMGYNGGSLCKRHSPFGAVQKQVPIIRLNSNITDAAPRKRTFDGD